MSAIVVAAVSASNEFNKSLQLINASSKTRMTSFKAAIVDPFSLPVGDCRGSAVSNAETHSLSVDETIDGHLDCSDQTNDETGWPDTTFTIRSFVSTVRVKDFSKCWPFRRSILERCSSIGMKPQLPPFDPPPKGQVDDEEDVWQEPAFTNDTYEQVPSKAAESMAQELLEKTSKQKLASNGSSTLTKPLVEASDKILSAGQQVGCDDGAVQLEETQSEEAWFEGVEKTSQPSAVAELCAVSERLCDGKEKKTDDDVETHGNKKADDNVIVIEGTTNTTLSHAKRIEMREDLVQRQRVAADTSIEVETPCFEIDSMDTKQKDLPDSETGSIQAIQASCNFPSDSTTEIEGQPHKIHCRLFSENCTMHVQAQELASIHNVEPPEVSACVEPCQNEVGGLGHEQSNVTPQLVDHGFIAQQNRVELGKSGEEFGATNAEALVPQVCPVCLSFTSTSNTALNAHIDHCLETVLPGEKTQARLPKNRIKARKMRSMVEICAVAPARTLEDLELSSQLWALNKEMSAKHVSCSLGWEDSLIRRQPRTRLYRGPARTWKGNSNLEGQNKMQQTLSFLEQNQPEKARMKYPVTKNASRNAKLGVSSSPSMNLSSNIDYEVSNDYDTAPPQQCESAIAKDKVSNHCDTAPPQQSESAVYASAQPRDSLQCLDQHEGLRITKKRKKKKSIVSKSRESFPLLNQNPADHSWSGIANCHGIIPVDTSAEEANRLLQGLASSGEFPQGQQSGFLISEKRGFGEYIISESGGTNNKHYKVTDVSKSVDTVMDKQQIKAVSLDGKVVSEAPKTQKPSQIDVDIVVTRTADDTVDNQVATENQFERPLKYKKVAPKTRSIANIETVLEHMEGELMSHNACQDLGSKKRAQIDGWQDATSGHHVYMKSDPINASISHQAKIVTMKRNTLGEVADKTKHVDFGKLHLPSCNLDIPTQQSPEGSSVGSDGAVVEHMLQGGVGSDNTDAASLTKGMPQYGFLKEMDLKQISGEFRLPTISKMDTPKVAPKNLNDAPCHSQRLNMNNQNSSFQSDLLMDLARTVTDGSRDTMGVRDMLPQMFAVENAADNNKQQNAFSTSPLSRLQTAHEQIIQMPLQANDSIYGSERGGGSVGSKTLQSARQMVTASTSTTTARHANLMHGNFNGSGQFLMLPSNQPIHGQFPSAGISGGQQNLELASRLNGYSSIDYPGEQGVVHIFGNPVFKLMGKNVMVTNQDFKSFGMGTPVAENGRQGFHPGGSGQHLDCMGAARDLGTVQDTRSQFPHSLLEDPIFMSQAVFSSSQVGAWQGDLYKPRNHSMSSDTAEHSLPLPLFGGLEHRGYREPTVPNPSISMSVLGESLKTSSGASVQLKRQAVAHAVDRAPSDIIVVDDSLPSSGTFLPAILSRGGRTFTHQISRPWSANPFSQSLNDPQVHSQAPALLCRQDNVASTGFLSDIHKLTLTGSCNFHASNHRSGTLSDIVQSSDRSKDRLWSTLPGPLQQKPI